MDSKHKKPELPINRILQGDAIIKLQGLPDQCVHCCITSPPYWGLRDYGVSGQMGMEKTPEEFIEKMVIVFREVYRVLRNDGTLWLNIGDSYAASNMRPHNGQRKDRDQSGMSGLRRQAKGLKPKDLVGIPWMLAFALRADGWYLRQDIIWQKPNPMPESVTDRCTKSHEYIFLLSKSGRYFFDAGAIKETASNNTHERRSRANIKNKSLPDAKKNGIRPAKLAEAGSGIKNNSSFHAALQQMPSSRNKRSVWSINPEAFPAAHFATFPQELVSYCIKAGSPEKGIVLDPFMGAGTTALVARKLDRDFIGVELKQQYIQIAEKRLQTELGLFP